MTGHTAGHAAPLRRHSPRLSSTVEPPLSELRTNPPPPSNPKTKHTPLEPTPNINPTSVQKTLTRIIDVHKFPRKETVDRGNTSTTGKIDPLDLETRQQATRQAGHYTTTRPCDIAAQRNAEHRHGMDPRCRPTSCFCTRRTLSLLALPSRKGTTPHLGTP